MKHLFKNPQKKGKSYICNSKDKILINLNEIKIKNFKKLNDTNGYFFDCTILNKNNKEEIINIRDIDIDAKETLIDNYNEWFDTTDNDKIDDIYINSLDDDNNMTIILSNKIDMEIVIDDKEVMINDLIEYLNMNKKTKNFIFNADLIFIGIYINDNNIINKWAFKTINIETIVDNDDFNRYDIEDEWKYDLIECEEIIKSRIDKMNKILENSKLLYNEIIIEKNIKNWEIKIDKLKNNILSIYDNR